MGYREHQDSDTLAFLGMAVVVVVFVLYLLRKGGAGGGTHARDAGPDPLASREAPAAVGASADAGASDPTEAFAADDRAVHFMAEDIKGIFLVVTSGAPQTQMVAMSLANQVLTKGRSVRVLLCDAGGDLALHSSPDVVFKPLDKSPKMLMKNLINNGVKVEVCPFYLANNGKSTLELIDGVGQAAPPDVADGLLAPGIKLFTF
jgi:predicted peroxiredoxin